MAVQCKFLLLQHFGQPVMTVRSTLPPLLAHDWSHSAHALRIHDHSRVPCCWLRCAVMLGYTDRCNTADIAELLARSRTSSTRHFHLQRQLSRIDERGSGTSGKSRIVFRIHTHGETPSVFWGLALSGRQHGIRCSNLTNNLNRRRTVFIETLQLRTGFERPCDRTVLLLSFRHFQIP